MGEKLDAFRGESLAPKALSAEEESAQHIAADLICDHPGLPPINVPVDLCGELHNRAESYSELQREQPWHRTVLYLSAAGNSAHEIAGITGYSYVHIRKVMAQSWFQKQYTSLLMESGKSDVEELLRSEAANSINTLINLRDHAKLETVKATAAINILDRVMGKPTQRTEVSVSKDPSKAADTIEKLKTENEDLERQIAEAQRG